MRTAAICPTCATYINALCVIYNGPNLTNTNVATLDNLETIVQKINNNLVPIYGSGAPTASAVYEGQIYINNATGDVYIATATGGGSADWVELALQSAIPPTPSLADVLLVGNTSVTSIVIKNLLVAPTETNKMFSDGNELSDTTQGLLTNYHINDIYITDTTTGDFLQIAIDNTQNQTITFPDTSGQLALLSDTHLNLQEITDNGNLTDDPIFADNFSSTATYTSNFVSLLGYVGDGTTAHGVLTLREDSDGTGFVSTITADIDLTADRTISIPDEDGTIVLSVNGNLADDQGNVVVTGLPTTSTLQDVLTNGASATGVGIDIIDAVINIYDTGVTNNISLDGTTGSVSITTGGGTGVITATNLTDLRSFELPDASGTLALTSNISLQTATAGTNKNLTNGINLQGTLAGNGQSGTEVIGIGTNAVENNTGSNIVGIGYYAANGNTGTNATAIGYSAMFNNTGNASVGIGYQAGQGNTGNAATMVGTYAGHNNTGDLLVAYGGGAGDSNTGNDCTFVGQSAGFNNTGNTNVGIGYQALQNNTDSTSIGIGLNAGRNNTSSSSGVIFIGANAGGSNTGGDIVGIGTISMSNNTGSNGVAIGNGAGQLNTGNNINVIGYFAGKQNSGDNLIAIGDSAGNFNSGNDVNVIGGNAGISNGLSGMTIISNSTLPSYLNYAAAAAAINVGTGASANSTYLYHDQTTNSIGAVRIP